MNYNKKERGPSHENDSDYVSYSKERARRQFIRQGASSEISSSLSASFIVPFAKDIGANALHIGLLSAFSGLLGPLGNLRGSSLMERYSRKTIHLNYTFWQVLLWLPMFALVFLFWRGIGTTYLPYALTLFYTLFTYVSIVKDPATFSWLGDIVSEDERGSYFSRRGKYIGWIGLAVFLLGGYILDVFETRGAVLLGYTVLFSAAVVFRFISAFQVRRIFSPHFKLTKGYYFSFWDFLKRYDNYGKFVMFQAVFNFAIMVASPFFAYYMLNDLGFNKLIFTIVSLSSTVFSLILMPLAGKFSDKYGNLKLLYIAGITFPMTPFIWIFLRDPWMLAIIPGFVSGVANAAFSIGVTNYTYDSTGVQKRGLCVAYAGVLNGFGIFAGSLLGGLLIQYLSISFMNTTLFVFALAAVLRVAAAVLFLPQLTEVRKTERLKGLSIDLHHPFKSFHSDVVWFKNFVKGR